MIAPFGGEGRQWRVVYIYMKLLLNMGQQSEAQTS